MSIVLLEIPQIPNNLFGSSTNYLEYFWKKLSSHIHCPFSSPLIVEWVLRSTYWFENYHKSEGRNNNDVVFFFIFQKKIEILYLFYQIFPFLFFFPSPKASLRYPKKLLPWLIHKILIYFHGVKRENQWNKILIYCKLLFSGIVIPTKIWETVLMTISTTHPAQITAKGKKR